MLYRPKTLIKIKRGCKNCGEGNNKPIYARNLCQYHYQIESLKRRVDKHKTEDEKIADKELWEWYQKCIKQSKLRCENCGSRIVPKEGKEHWSVCHVLPKNIFKSIKTNDDNWIELCYTCHTLYDRYLDEHDERMMQMRIWNMVVAKFKILYPVITERRKNSLPIFLLNELQGH